MMNIITERLYDETWLAYDEDTYDGAPDAAPNPMGWGKTEEEAEADLRHQMEEVA